MTTANSTAVRWVGRREGPSATLASHSSAGGKEPTASNAVVIDVDGPIAYVRNLPPAVAEHLSVPVWQSGPGTRAVRGRRPLLTRRWAADRGGDVQVTAAGLRSIVARLARGAGLPVSTRGQAPSPLGPPDLTRVCR